LIKSSCILFFYQPGNSITALYGAFLLPPAKEERESLIDLGLQPQKNDAYYIDNKDAEEGIGTRGGIVHFHDLTQDIT